MKPSATARVTFRRMGFANPNVNASLGSCASQNHLGMQHAANVFARWTNLPSQRPSAAPLRRAQRLPDQYDLATVVKRISKLDEDPNGPVHRKYKLALRSRQSRPLH